MSKLYYSIAEVAEMLQVNQSLLRFWEKAFAPLINPHKNAKGTRSYKEEDILVLKQIYYLVRVQGLTLAGAQKKMSDSKSQVATTQEIYTRLTQVKQELLALKNGLTLPTDIPDIE